MIKQDKTKLTRMFFGILFAGIIIAGCNNSSDSAKTETKDTAAPATPPAAEVKKDTNVVVNPGDTATMKGNTKPTPEKP